MSALKNNGEDEKEKKTDSPEPAKNAMLYYFDPNTLDQAGWKRLGLREKTINTITHYLEKGGRFRKPEDLLKVYGIHNEEYALLKPYVRITNEATKKPFKPSTSQPFNPSAYSASWRIRRTQSTSPHFNPSISQPIDINRADTNTFMAFRGIGQKLAARIILFRERLGGFYSVDQVRETYGLPDSIFISIRPMLKIAEGEEDSVRKINLNSSAIEVLKQHPYIRWNLARAIVEFRNQHGPFSKPEDLEKLHILSQAEIQKITPYLKIN